MTATKSGAKSARKAATNRGPSVAGELGALLGPQLVYLPSKQPEAEGVQEKFASARRVMDESLIERTDEIDLALTAMIAQESCLLVGPPGCAKSLLLDSVVRWMGGANKFSVLLTKFSTPEDLFGPVSVQGLKADVYRRITTNKLPEAHVAFIDEIWKASSAILNSLLRILNERVYENGSGAFCKVPLRLCVAASNEWPGNEGGKELAALFDRFLFRKKVKTVATQAGRRRLLWERDHTPSFAESITTAEIDQAHAEAMALPWTDTAKESLETIIQTLAKEGVVPGDRRQFKSVTACQAFAYLCGASEVRQEHLEILSHVLWDDPAEQPEKVAQVVATIANPVGMAVNGLLAETEAIIGNTNVRDLAQAATAVAKLQEIWKKLAAIPGGNGRVEKAKEYVATEGKRIKVASVENL